MRLCIPLNIQDTIFFYFKQGLPGRSARRHRAHPVLLRLRHARQGGAITPGVCRHLPGGHRPVRLRVYLLRDGPGFWH